jgi:GR25 family glycosyltransferase involved in LPS biosynthesis
MLKQYLISLDYEKSTRFSDQAIKSSKAYNWNIIKHKGIDGFKIDIKAELDKRGLFFSNHTHKFVSETLRKGMIGCILSHYDLWKMCLNIREQIAIFEEDVIFIDKMPEEKYEDVLKLRLGEKSTRSSKAGTWWIGADCYIIKPKAVKKIFNWIKTNGVLPPDHLLGTNIVNVKHTAKDICKINPEVSLTYPKYSLTSIMEKYV